MYDAGVPIGCMIHSTVALKKLWRLKYIFALDCFYGMYDPEYRCIALKRDDSCGD